VTAGSEKDLRWEHAREVVENWVEEHGIDGLRRQVNEQKKNPKAYHFCLEGRKYLVEHNRDPWELVGLAAAYRRTALELEGDAREGEKRDLLERAIEIYDEAAKADSSTKLRNSVYVGEGAVYFDLGNVEKAYELCELVLKTDPGNEYALALMKRVDPKWSER
jgi:tetratricopeptide (TPR) repeat protein